MNDKGWAANSGSCPTGQAPSGLVATRDDPGRIEVATFSQSRNDLHWNLWDGEFIRWAGYDDDYWWSKVSATDQFRVRRGAVTGRTYRLDPTTNAVEITETSNGN